VHNFTDGLLIGASFLVSIIFGLITTLMIILHEIPQEIGDFGVLVYGGGFTKFKALYFNFLIALTCVLGAIAGYFISVSVKIFPYYCCLSPQGALSISAPATWCRNYINSRI